MKLSSATGSRAFLNECRYAAAPELYMYGSRPHRKKRRISNMAYLRIVSHNNTHQGY
jgi:hypothetical protein